MDTIGMDSNVARTWLIWFTAALMSLTKNGGGKISGAGIRFSMEMALSKVVCHWRILASLTVTVPCRRARGTRDCTSSLTAWTNLAADSSWGFN